MSQERIPAGHGDLSAHRPPRRAPSPSHSPCHPLLLAPAVPFCTAQAKEGDGFAAHTATVGTVPPNPPRSPSHITPIPGTWRRGRAGVTDTRGAPNTPRWQLNFWGDAAALRTPGARHGGTGAAWGGPRRGVPGLGSPGAMPVPAARAPCAVTHGRAAAASPNLVPWGSGSASPAPLQRR